MEPLEILGIIAGISINIWSITTISKRKTPSYWLIYALWSMAVIQVVIFLATQNPWKIVTATTWIVFAVLMYTLRNYQIKEEK